MALQDSVRAAYVGIQAACVRVQIGKPHSREASPRVGARYQPDRLASENVYGLLPDLDSSWPPLIRAIP